MNRIGIIAGILGAAVISERVILFLSVRSIKRKEKIFNEGEKNEDVEAGISGHGYRGQGSPHRAELRIPEGPIPSPQYSTSSSTSSHPPPHSGRSRAHTT